MMKKHDMIDTVLNGVKTISTGIEVLDDFLLGGFYFPVYLIYGHARNILLWNFFINIVKNEANDEIYKCYFSSTKSPHRMLTDLFTRLQNECIMQPIEAYKNGGQSGMKCVRDGLKQATKVYDKKDDYIELVGGRYGGIMDMDEEVDRNAPPMSRAIVFIEDINRVDGDYGNLQDLASNNNAIVVATVGDNDYCGYCDRWYDECDIAVKLNHYFNENFDDKVSLVLKRHSYYNIFRKIYQSEPFTIVQNSNLVKDNNKTIEEVFGVNLEENFEKDFGVKFEQGDNKC
jgi:hypothetical protein